MKADGRGIMLRYEGRVVQLPTVLLAVLNTVITVGTAICIGRGTS